MAGEHAIYRAVLQGWDMHYVGVGRCMAVRDGAKSNLKTMSPDPYSLNHEP